MKVITERVWVRVGPRTAWVPSRRTPPYGSADRVAHPGSISFLWFPVPRRMKGVAHT